MEQNTEDVDLNVFQKENGHQEGESKQIKQGAEDMDVEYKENGGEIKETKLMEHKDYDKPGEAIDANVVVNNKANGSQKHPVEPTPVGPKDERDGNVVVDKMEYSKKTEAVAERETPCSAAKEMVIPFVLSGFGNMGGGMILQVVQNWPAFVHIPQFLIISPALLGLKGNVEMTLCSRMSTYANLGQLNDKDRRWQIISGNIANDLFQSSVVGMLAPLIALLITLIVSPVTGEKMENLSFGNFLIIVSTSIITTNISSVILSTLMCFVICVSKLKFNINPDNIATPIAASSGDLIVMGVLGICSLLIFDCYYKDIHLFIGLPLFFATLCCLLTPIWALIACRNEYVGSAVFRGLLPIITGMIIQNIGGKILERTADTYKTYAVFQVIINGFGGDLVAVHSSRISTYLHQVAKYKHLPETDPNICVTPWYAYFSRNFHSRFAIILVCIAAPSQIPFLFIVFLTTDKTKATFMFVLIYSIACTAQVILILYIAYCLIHFLWVLGVNPDNAAIPIMTALADFFGSTFLTAAFILLHHLKDPNAVQSGGQSSKQSNSTYSAWNI